MQWRLGTAEVRWWCCQSALARSLSAASLKNSCISSTELLNLGTMTFEPGPQMMLSSRIDCAVVTIDARRVLVIGGYDGLDSHLALTDREVARASIFR